jgi:hypothetical protein
MVNKQGSPFHPMEPRVKGQIEMQKLLMAAIAGTAMAAATPAFAANTPATPANDPCTYSWVVGAVACQGYYGGNLITGTTGSATTADENTYINLLLNGTASTSDSLPTSNGTAYNPPYLIPHGTVLGAIEGLNGSATLNFGSLNLSGLTIVGAHFGNNPDSNPSDPNVQDNSITAFWLVDLGNTTTHTLTLTNGQGSSNAQIFGTGGSAVPEPATWAMMLLGFAGIGVSMRRRRPKPTLMQIA